MGALKRIAALLLVFPSLRASSFRRLEYIDSVIFSPFQNSLVLRVLIGFNTFFKYSQVAHTKDAMILLFLTRRTMLVYTKKLTGYFLPHEEMIEEMIEDARNAGNEKESRELEQIRDQTRSAGRGT